MKVIDMNAYSMGLPSEQYGHSVTVEIVPGAAAFFLKRSKFPRSKWYGMQISRDNYSETSRDLKSLEGVVVRARLYTNNETLNPQNGRQFLWAPVPAYESDMCHHWTIVDDIPELVTRITVDPSLARFSVNPECPYDLIPDCRYCPEWSKELECCGYTGDEI